MTVEDLQMIRSMMKVAVNPGGLIVFQCPKIHMQEFDGIIKSIVPLLKSKDIAALVVDDEVSFVMVPEARRILTLARTA